MKFSEFLETKKISQEQFEAKTDEEKLALNDEFGAIKQKALDEALEAKADASVVAELKTELEALKTEKNDRVFKVMNEQGVELAKLRKEIEAAAKGQPEGFTQAVFKHLEENKDEIKEMLKEGKGKISFDVQYKVQQDASDITSGTDFAFMEPGVGQIATRQPFVRELFPNRTVGTEYIKYNDQETIVRDAKNVSGCAASTHLSKITWQVRTLQITKVRDFVDVCIDMMDDYDFVEGEIRSLVDTDVRLKVDNGLLLDDGIYPNLNSIDAVAATFAAGVYALDVQAAQLIDLIKVGSCTISDSGQNNAFNANWAILNPSDECLMTLIKDQNDNYIMPNFITADGKNIGAVRILSNPLVPANQMYIFDSTKGVVYSNKGITVDLSFENNDNFEKELVTVKAYERLNFRVRNVDVNAFLHFPDIAAAITAITAL